MRKGDLVNFSTTIPPVRVWGYGAIHHKTDTGFVVKIDLEYFDWDVQQPNSVWKNRVRELDYNTIPLLVREKIITHSSLTGALVAVPAAGVWLRGDENRDDLEMRHEPMRVWTFADGLDTAPTNTIAYQSLIAVKQNALGDMWEEITYRCPNCKQMSPDGMYWGGRLRANCKSCGINVSIAIKLPKKTAIERFERVVKKSEQIYFDFGGQPQKEF
jgi:hypothetical protein